MSIFKACDIRGVVGDQWDVPQARQIGAALGRMAALEDQTAFCVGGDFRRSTPRLKEALIEGLIHAGMQVYDVGQVPTPLVHFAADRLACPNAAVVTASHNPGRYNGVKFALRGRPAVPEMIDRLQQLLDDPPVSRAAGRVETMDFRAPYKDWLREQADRFLAATAARGHRSEESIRQAGLTIVVDAMSGACTHLAPQLLADSGYRFVAVSEAIDPDFASGAPNPADDRRLSRLIEAVQSGQADVGFALDGDGDRAIFVDHRGSIVRPEQVAAILVRFCSHRPTVVYDLKCASVLPQAVLRAEGRAVMRPSGYGYIKTTMIELAADLGVEASGHHFFGALRGGDDGLFTALVVLGLLRRSGQTLADLVAPLGWPAITPDLRIPYPGDAPQAVQAIGARCRMPITRLDGVRADYGDGWALARASITEAAITLRFEGPDWRRVREIVRDFLAGAPSLREAALSQLTGFED